MISHKLLPPDTNVAPIKFSAGFASRSLFVEYSSLYQLPQPRFLVPPLCGKVQSCSAEQYSTVQCSAVQYTAVQYYILQ